MLPLHLQNVTSKTEREKDREEGERGETMRERGRERETERDRERERETDRDRETERQRETSSDFRWFIVFWP